MGDEAIETTWQLLRTAVIEHVRCWWAEDALLFERFVASAGKLDRTIVDDVSRAYIVRRCILSGKDQRVANLINGELESWPDDLLARAAHVRGIGDEAKSLGLTNGVALSAISKLIWFARPRGWTIYDRFARQGLDARASGDYFNDFYNRLSAIGFSGTMDRCHDVIGRSRLSYLWPERIHDKYLMLCGQLAVPNRKIIQDQGHDQVLVLWERFHGGDICREINRLIDDLTEAVWDKPAFQVHTTRQGR